MTMLDLDKVYSLIISQLLQDGYNIIAITLANLVKKHQISHTPSNELFRLVKLGQSVSDSQILPEPETSSSPKSDTPEPMPVPLSSSNIPTVAPDTPEVIVQSHSNLHTNETCITGLSSSEEIKQESGGISPEIANLLQTPRRRLIGFEKDIITLPSGDNPKGRLFKCATCEKVYNRRDKARRHIIEIHYGIRAFVCQFCQKSFTRNDKLVRHVMSVHHRELKPALLCSLEYRAKLKPPIMLSAMRSFV
ncbi:hypothetical protein Ciccas_000362 [Cichlidogyrus casuarinus]|uniref:C2H2-type domain-containing protein n=1 Tax=Cichlidogyrus casuarinus TaxID=1844966 RepID=A0ABD2QP78_9PLAT